MQPPTVNDCVNFIKDHGVLPEWDYFQIQEAICKAIKECSLTYSVAGDGRIDGICLCKWNSSDSLHVIAMVGKGKIKTFYPYLKNLYPQVKLLTYNRSKPDLKFKQLKVK